MVKCVEVEFQGTKREREIYERVLGRNTPSRDVIEQYEVDARYFRNDIRRIQPSGQVHSASIRKSLLFGYHYACLYLSDERFLIGGHDYNAFCRASWGTFRSPVICLPHSKSRDRSRHFQSIVEHEIVHANQALCKRLPSIAMERDDVWGDLLGTPKERRVLTVKETVEETTTHATAEFEAYFLQCGRWPTEENTHVERVTKFTLFKSCFARAWVDALSRLLVGAYCGHDLLAAALDGVQESMYSLLIQLDALPEDAEWFTNDQRRVVKIAAEEAPPDFQRVALAWDVK